VKLSKLSDYGSGLPPGFRGTYSKGSMSASQGRSVKR